MKITMKKKSSDTGAKNATLVTISPGFNLLGIIKPTSFPVTALFKDHNNS
jgi:hypothetical protein